jgi:hypothetical protein
MHPAPRAQELTSLDTLLKGPPVKKLLFMSSPATVDGHLMPHWSKALRAGSGAAVMQAVPNMLEVVPEGVNKWVGAQVRERERSWGQESERKERENSVETVSSFTSHCSLPPLFSLSQVLLKNLGFRREDFMAVGDGSNDFELVANAGVGVAMGNAVNKVGGKGWQGSVGR